ncbi:MAG: FMN-binding negative transcriptional regulator [Glaciecola sp.]
MFTPKHFKMPEQAISAFIHQHSFATLITQNLQATRLPLLYDASKGSLGVILGHMARANPQHKELNKQRVSVMFDGPHSYISPTWYTSSPAVPTWNYASVQCFGTFYQLDKEQTLQAIHDVVAKYEPNIANDTILMPSEYVNKLVSGVVGFRIEIDDIHATEKLGQHKKLSDQQGVFEALSNSQHQDAIELAKYMQRRGVGTGHIDKQ